MRERAPWKVATFLALGAATSGWLLQRWHATPSTDQHETSGDRPDSVDESSGSRVRDRSVQLHDGLADLSARLAGAVTPSAACEAFADLSHHGGDRAAEVIAAGVRARHEIRSRRCGIEALASLGRPVALAALTQFADSDDPAILTAVFGGLARSGLTDALEIVRAAVDNGEPAQRQAALVALGAAHVRDAAPSIADALEHALGGTQRRDLLRALGGAGEPTMVAVVLRYMTDPDPRMRDVAYGALGDLDGNEAVAALTQTLLTAGALDAAAAARALATSRLPAARTTLITTAQGAGIAAMHAASALVGADGDDVQAAMSAILSSSNPRVVGAGIDHVVARHDLAAIQRLIELADHPSRDVADQAVTALGELGGEPARTALESLASRPGDAQLSALEQLLKLPDAHDRAIDTIIALARDEGGPQSETAVRLIATDPSPAARTALLEFARGNDVVAMAAVGELGGQRDADSLRLLEDIVRNGATDRIGLRSAALQQIAGRGGADSDAEQFVLQAARDPDADRRSEGIRSLMQMQTPSATRVLLDAVNSPESDEATRRETLWALRQSRGPRDIEATTRLLSHPDAVVSAAALSMLADVAPGRAADEIQQRAGSPVSTARASAIASAASLPSATAQPLLIAALHDNELAVASAAVDGLARIGGHNAGDALAAILTSTTANPALQRFAARRLMAMGGEVARAHGELIDGYLQAPDEL